MSLAQQYKKLLIEYDRVLNLSKRILTELRNEGKEDDLNTLLEKKRKAGETIAYLIKRVASSEINSPSNLNPKTRCGERSSKPNRQKNKASSRS